MIPNEEVSFYSHQMQIHVSPLSAKQRCFSEMHSMMEKAWVEYDRLMRMPKNCDEKVTHSEAIEYAYKGCDLHYRSSKESL